MIPKSHWPPFSPLSSVMDTTPGGFCATGNLRYHYKLKSKTTSFPDLSAFLKEGRKINTASPVCHIPWLILSPFLILSPQWFPLCRSPSPPLFCSQSFLSGPTWLGIISVSTGPGGSGTRPWTQTGWLASYLHSGLCVPFSSAYCWTVRA